jgi:hypothetical protein
LPLAVRYGLLRFQGCYESEVLTVSQFQLAYKSLCPSGWYNRWDEQRGACACRDERGSITDHDYRGW